MVLSLLIQINGTTIERIDVELLGHYGRHHRYQWSCNQWYGIVEHERDDGAVVLVHRVVSDLLNITADDRHTK